MSALFAGNQEAFGTHGLPDWDEDKSKWGIKGTAKTWRGPTTAAMWADHLSGRKPLGVVPIRADSTCWWGCGDIDDYDIDAIALIVRIEQLGYPLVPCRSKSGGLHLFLFLREPESAAAVQACVRDMMASLGHATAEVFPKQVALVHERDQGNWMVMPYYGGDFDGRLQMQYGLKRAGGEMTLGEFLRAAEAARTTTASVRIARGGGPRLRGAAGPSNPKSPPAPFADGPPCLQHLAAAGVAKGGQDNALFMMGLYFKRAYPDDWRAKLEAANATYLATPGDAQFVTEKIRSLERKDYEYKCRDEPMRSFCNSALCRTRRHGVGESNRFPQLSGLVKYSSDPPLWFVNVEPAPSAMRPGEEPPRLELSTEDLWDYRRFCLACLARIHRSFAPMKPGDWAGVLAEALEDLVVEDVAPELKTGPQVQRYLSEYLTNKMQARKKEELPQGRPWCDEAGEWGAAGDYYMSLDRFMDSLKDREKWTKSRVSVEIARPPILAKKLKQRTVGRRSVNLWRVPGGAVVREAPLELPSGDVARGVEKI